MSKWIINDGTCSLAKGVSIRYVCRNGLKDTGEVFNTCFKILDRPEDIVKYKYSAETARQRVLRKADKAVKKQREKEALFNDIRPAPETLFNWERGVINNKYGHKFDANIPASVTEDGKQKAPLTWLPAKVIESVAGVVGWATQKYEAHSWKTKPTTQAKRVASASRHINKWLQGIDLDDESGLHHLDHAICQLMFAKEYVHMGVDDDRN